MKDKYYTPTIEEFHVGFEYESSYLEDYDTWKKEIIDTVDVGYFYSTYTGDAVPTEFRVKYLDREDIESLGFIFVADEWWHKTNIGDNWQILKIGKNSYQITYGQNEYIDKSKGMFSGVIKNKSELKRLLKQLNI